MMTDVHSAVDAEPAAQDAASTETVPLITRIRSAWAARSGQLADTVPDGQPAESARPAQKNEQRNAATARPTMQRTAFVLVLIMAGIVALVAAVALALNFEHGRQLAQINGEIGWRAVLWPLAVDGLLIASSLVGLVRRLLGLSVGFRSRAAFIAGIAASAGANVVLALHSDLAGWELAERIGVMTWPTMALLLSHEMGLQMVAYYARVIDVFGVEGPDENLVAAEQARQRAEDAARAARTLADEQRAAHQREIERLRAELASVRQSAETARADAERTITELRADLNEASDQLGALDDELERLRSAEQYRSSAPARRSAEEWEQLRHDAQVWAREYVKECGEIPTGPMVSARFTASDRWANNVLRNVMDELLDLRNAIGEHQDERPMTAEASTEDVVSVG